MEKKPSKYPHLIYRNDEAIEDEISTSRAAHETQYQRLKALFEKFEAWTGERATVQTFADFIRSTNPETVLLEIYRQRNSIPNAVKIERIADVYDVPDYSEILNSARSFARMPESDFLAFFDANKRALKRPEFPENEKELIVLRHSVFVQDEHGFDLFTAANYLCKALNLINFNLNEQITTNKINLSHIKTGLPSIAQFLKMEQPDTPDGYDKKQRFAVNFPAFKK